MADTTVKHFTSAMSGAPSLNNTAGALIALLDACLVTGFGSITADSVVVSGGIATLTRGGGVGAFTADAVALIAGANPTALNGEKRIISKTATTVTFDATGVADQTATGTITAKMAPAKWAKIHSGTNLAAYQSTEVTSTKMIMRVDDTGTSIARVLGCEYMTDINTYGGVFTMAAGGSYWNKHFWPTSPTTPVSWTLVANGNCLYLHVYSWQTSSATTPSVGGLITVFGDIIPTKAGDPYACIFTGPSSDQSQQQTVGMQYHIEQSQYAAGYFYMPRAYHGLGGAVSVGIACESFTPAIGHVSGNASTFLSVYPNPADSALYLSKKIVYEAGGLRGRLKGIFHALQNCHASFTHLDKVDGTGEFSGRKLMALKCGAPAVTVSTGVMFIDITGPWE